MMQLWLLRRIVLALLVTLFASTINAAEIKVAVAANFTEPAKEIAAAVREGHGSQTHLELWSHGRLLRSDQPRRAF